MHYDGDPAGCRENCTGPHYEDLIPAGCCAECGGNLRACWPACTHRPRRFELDEGSTGAE